MVIVQIDSMVEFADQIVKGNWQRKHVDGVVAHYCQDEGLRVEVQVGGGGHVEFEDWPVWDWVALVEVADTVVEGFIEVALDVQVLAYDLRVLVQAHLHGEMPVSQVNHQSLQRHVVQSPPIHIFQQNENIPIDQSIPDL
jgi:hypothetical protein